MRIPQRGRAIVRHLSQHDVVQTFRPGDFLLTQSNAGVARVLGWSTGSALNHAALIIDPLGSVIEATPTYSADGRAYRLSSVGEYLRAGKPCWIGYVELREGTRQDVVAYAQHLLRIPDSATIAGRTWLVLHTLLSIAPRTYTARYSWMRAFHQFLERHAFVLREEHCYSSGEFVARALERGGFIWDCDPSHVTPAALFERYHPVEEETAPTVLEFDRLRRQRGAKVPVRRQGDGQASITSIAPRRQRTIGATALEEIPQRAEVPQAGVRALLQVGFFMATGLALIGVVEEVLRLTGLEA